LELRAERAVLVGSDRGGDEQPIAKRTLLLGIEAERLDGGRLLVRCRLGGGGCHRFSTRRKLRAAGVREVALLIDVVGADGRLEVRPRPHVPRRVAHDLRREVALVVVIVGDLAEPRVPKRRAFVQMTDLISVSRAVS
jgi:hypothetical protein